MTHSSHHPPRSSSRGQAHEGSQPTAPQRAVRRRAATSRHLPRWLPQAVGAALALALLVGVVALVRAYSASAGTPATAGSGATTGTAGVPTTLPAAPDFTLATLSGTPFHLASQRGHVVVLYFMATTYGTCVQGSHDLVQALTASRAPGAQAVAIDLNAGDRASDLRGFVQATGLPANAPIVWGVDTSGAIARAYGVQVLETTVVINAQGHVAYTSAGPVPPAQLAQVVSRLP